MLRKDHMPYTKKSDLPKHVKDNLPGHAEEIYKETFNSAWRTYADPRKRRGKTSREEVAHRVAWAAVKKKYHRGENQWEPGASS